MCVFPLWSVKIERMWLSIRMITPTTHTHARPGQAKLLLVLRVSWETLDKLRSFGSAPKSCFLFDQIWKKIGPR